MTIRNSVIVSLIGARASLLAVNVPFLSLLSCLFCVGFWARAVLAVWLYRRLTGPIMLKEAVVVGWATGPATGAIGFRLSFAGLAGGTAIANSIKAAAPEAEFDIPGGSGIVFTLCGVGVDIAFGALGGLIGGALFGARK
jgi:hypothetical protein